MSKAVKSLLKRKSFRFVTGVISLIMWVIVGLYFLFTKVI